MLPYDSWSTFAGRLPIPWPELSGRLLSTTSL